ncbi:hypothetical protein KAJ38_00890 [Candidatus Pacearchaeota archaeon]|nr:hypothetical protein [Candidatus Pacearchaeota archaeon]
MKRITIFILIGIIGTLFGVIGYLSYSELEEHEHDHSVEIEGSEMKSLTVQEVADLWEIDSNVLLSGMVTEFRLEENYDVNSVLESIREEYAFSPALVKDIAEEIKRDVQNE